MLSLNIKFGLYHFCQRTTADGVPNQSSVSLYETSWEEEDWIGGIESSVRRSLNSLVNCELYDHHSPSSPIITWHHINIDYTYDNFIAFNLFIFVYFIYFTMNRVQIKREGWFTFLIPQNFNYRRWTNEIFQIQWIFILHNTRLVRRSG